MNEADLRIAAERVGLRLTSKNGRYRLNDAWGLPIHPSTDWITAADAEHYIGHEPMHREEIGAWISIMLRRQARKTR